MCITDLWRSDRTGHWAVVLAGGDGARLRPLTRLIAGDERPKQFCPILGERSLLEQTLGRASLAAPSDHTLVVVNQAHERFYLPLLENLPSQQLIVQPGNRGTAPAVLYSLLRLAARDPQARVVYFPSDHSFSDEKKFISHVQAGFEAAEFCPELITLLGMAPKWPEVEYGWIEASQPVSGRSPFPLYRVGGFREKPSLPVATALMERGCFWNSFVMAGRVQAFLEMTRRALPDLYNEFIAVWPHLDTAEEEREIRALYSRLRSADFSEEVLAARPDDLAVLPVSDVEWSDWGEPRRALSELRRTGQDVTWAIPTHAAAGL